MVVVGMVLVNMGFQKRESEEGYWSLEGSRGGDRSGGCCGVGDGGGRGSVDNADHGHTGQSGRQRRNPDRSQ